MVDVAVASFQGKKQRQPSHRVRHPPVASLCGANNAREGMTYLKCSSPPYTGNRIQAHDLHRDEGGSKFKGVFNTSVAQK